MCYNSIYLTDLPYDWSTNSQKSYLPTKKVRKLNQIHLIKQLTLFQPNNQATAHRKKQTVTDQPTRQSEEYCWYDEMRLNDNRISQPARTTNTASHLNFLTFLL